MNGFGHHNFDFVWLIFLPRILHLSRWCRHLAVFGHQIYLILSQFPHKNAVAHQDLLDLAGAWMVDSNSALHRIGHFQSWFHRPRATVLGIFLDWVKLYLGHFVAKVAGFVEAIL